MMINDGPPGTTGHFELTSDPPRMRVRVNVAKTSKSYNYETTVEVEWDNVGSEDHEFLVTDGDGETPLSGVIQGLLLTADGEARAEIKRREAPRRTRVVTLTVETVAIEPGDRVRRTDARLDRGVGVVDEVTPEKRPWPAGAYVRWPDDGASSLGYADRRRSWIALTALIRVGGQREAIGS